MISVTILVKNGQKHLEQVLKALSRFDEILLYDTGSVDETRAIAARFSNVKIYDGPFEGFGPTHNRASSLATHDWIFSIDADEAASEDLVDEVLSLQLDDTCVYSVPRHNFYRGKWIKGCGWYPDRVFRLYNRTQTQFSEALVHEAVVTTHLKKIPLKGALNHYPYETISDFLMKMQSYSTLFAKQYAHKRRASLSTALLHGFFAFFKSYILKRGLFFGHEGFVISLYNGHTAYYKYLKLQEMNSQ